MFVVELRAWLVSSPRSQDWLHCRNKTFNLITKQLFCHVLYQTVTSSRNKKEGGLKIFGNIELYHWYCNPANTHHTTLICCSKCLLCHLLIMLQVFISIDKVGLQLGVKVKCLDTYNTHLCHFVTWMMKYDILACHRCTVNWFIFILDRYLPHKFHSNQNVYRYGRGWGWPQWYQPSLQDTCVQFTLLPIFCTLWNGSGH